MLTSSTCTPTLEWLTMGWLTSRHSCFVCDTVDTLSDPGARSPPVTSDNPAATTTHASEASDSPLPVGARCFLTGKCRVQCECQQRHRLRSPNSSAQRSFTLLEHRRAVTVATTLFDVRASSCEWPMRTLIDKMALGSACARTSVKNPRRQWRSSRPVALHWFAVALDAKSLRMRYTLRQCAMTSLLQTDDGIVRFRCCARRARRTLSWELHVDAKGKLEGALTQFVEQTARPEFDRNDECLLELMIQRDLWAPTPPGHVGRP